LKGEVRSVIQALEDLGMAIAPAAGLAGAGERLSALPQRAHRPAPPPPPAPAPPAAAGSVPAAPSSALFDYVGFERRFRGDPEAVAAALADRYLDLLVAN